MKSSTRIALFLLVFTALILAACGAPATPQTNSVNQVAPGVPQRGNLYNGQAPDVGAPPSAKSGAGGAAQSGVTIESGPALQPGGLAQSGPANAPADSGSSTGSTANPLPDTATIQTGTDTINGGQSDRMIIKNAELKLLVDKTDNAIDRSMQVVSDVGGYIISSREWYQASNGENYKFATLSIGVPVVQFETAMQRLRGIAKRVLDENASGQDVTSEYVDLQSQLGNLEATRDRIRAFLADAKTVEESLQINQELTTIEGQIEQVKGRMNFISNRSAYSTITVNFEPDIPPLTPTPTPTLVPTPTPQVWSPGETMHQATGAVTNIYQGFAELAIWFFVVIVPLLAPPALIIWAIYKLVTRRTKKTETIK